MQPSAHRPGITADDRGIHFVGIRDKDIVVPWGEIESIDAAKYTSIDNTTFVEVYVNHISGVDFRFHSTEDGSANVLAAMERHLIGFKPSGVQSAGTWEENLDRPPLWKRDERLQPFQFEPPVIDNRPPTDAERQQMVAAHQASVATCERILGRALLPAELACVQVGFENARIVGNIASPLSKLLAARGAGSTEGH